jgi:putative transposase
MTITGYRYRIYPTAAQAGQLARTFGCVRYVYNWALALKSKAFRERGACERATTEGEDDADGDVD